MDVLIVVDMQNDFIDGSLGTKEAKDIVVPIAQYIRGFDGLVILTRDLHGQNYLKTHEGRRLPVPHAQIGTQGSLIHGDIRSAARFKAYEVLEKDTFSCGDLIKQTIERYLRGEMHLGTMYLCGLNTDICVISNALSLRKEFPETDIVVLKDLCAGTSPAHHKAALKVMESCHIDME